VEQSPGRVLADSNSAEAAFDRETILCASVGSPRGVFRGTKNLTPSPKHQACRHVLA